MQVIDAQGIGQFLGGLPVGDLDEGIVPQVVGDALLTQPRRQHAVAVAVELQAEWVPR